MPTKKIERDVYKVDASGKVPGRIASDIAHHLIGKHKVSYQPHIDAGDVVEVTNVAEMKIHPKKLLQKKYHNHSGYPGGLRTRTLEEVIEKDPAKVLEYAVSRMLPKNKHRATRMKRLKIS